MQGLIDDEQERFRAGKGCIDQIFIYMGFIDLEKPYNRVNREALWQVFRWYDMEGKLFIGIKSMYVDSSACIRLKRGENEQFRIDSRVRQGFIMSP